MEYCTVTSLCDFLAAHFQNFESYGLEAEFVGDDARPRAALKPRFLFRGQTKSWDTLRPTIYRDYEPLSTWQRDLTVSAGSDELVMPHAHYSAALEREFYFSCVKAAEAIGIVSKMFSEFPRQIDGHALCQHYGLRTHFLDFTQDAYIAGFFASHSFAAGAWVGRSTDVGVIYVLDTAQVPRSEIYEIGYQPLARPAAQRGFLLRVPPDLKLLAHPCVTTFYFQHDMRSSKVINDRFANGDVLMPRDDVGEEVFRAIQDRRVSSAAVAAYLSCVPSGDRERVAVSITERFRGVIPID